MPHSLDLRQNSFPLRLSIRNAKEPSERHWVMCWLIQVQCWWYFWSVYEMNYISWFMLCMIPNSLIQKARMHHLLHSDNLWFFKYAIAFVSLCSTSSSCILVIWKRRHTESDLLANCRQVPLLLVKFNPYHVITTDIFARLSKQISCFFFFFSSWSAYHEREFNLLRPYQKESVENGSVKIVMKHTQSIIWNKLYPASHDWQGVKTNL